MLKKTHSPILFLILVVLQWSCATSNTTTLSDSASTNQVALKKIMVLSLGGNYENRKILESEMTYYINDAGYEALPAIKYLPEKLLPSNEKIVEVLETYEFDGILAVELVDLEVKDKFVNAKQNYVANPATPTFYNYFDIYRNRYSVGYSTQELSYVVETRIFDVASREAVYETTTKTIAKENLDKAMEDFAKNIAKSINKSGVMVKTK